MSGSLTWRTLHTLGCSRRTWSWCHPHTWAHYHDNSDTMTITRLATGVACVPVTLESELLVRLYRQFWPQGSSGQPGLVPGHRESPWPGSDVRCHDDPLSRLTSQALIWPTIWPRTVEQDWGNCHSILQEACHGYLNRLPTNSRLKCKWLWSKQTGVNKYSTSTTTTKYISFSLFTWRLHDFPRVGRPGWWQK